MGRDVSPLNLVYGGFMLIYIPNKFCVNDKKGNIQFPANQAAVTFVTDSRDFQQGRESVNIIRNLI
jgi:hypothetical protein